MQSNPTEKKGYTAGSTYHVTGGWYKGRIFKLEGFFPERDLDVAFGYLTEDNTRLNLPLKHLANPNTDRIRQAAQRLLKTGNKKAALKLLQTLNK